MSRLAKKIVWENRPEGHRGRMDKYLPDIASELQRLVIKTQACYKYETCVLDADDASILAAIFTGFAEDIHADLGLWRSIEAANLELFGTPLPFVVKKGDMHTGLAAFDSRRILFLTTTIFPSFLVDTALSPRHADLVILAEAVSEYLTVRFEKMPTESGVKLLLATDNSFAWDIKRKLVWLGTKSYLFRLFFDEYFDEHADEEDGNEISVIDDFVCQGCTRWSGLGAINVLARALPLSEEDRETLQTWYERHAACYRITSVNRSARQIETLTARNVINGKPYEIRMNMPQTPFTSGLLVQGSLTPWRGEWYWSGIQQPYHDADASLEDEIRSNFIQKSPKIAYRYCKPEVRKAREFAQKNHDGFVAHYGSDLMVFPSGYAAAAAEQKRMAALWAAADPAAAKKAIIKYGIIEPKPAMSFSPEFLDHEHGVGVYSTPHEGVEYVLWMHDFISGLKKNGNALTDDEAFSIRGIMESDMVTAAFVRRLASEYGSESIAAAYFVPDEPPELALEVILRCYKGENFRRIYPNISLVN